MAAATLAGCGDDLPTAPDDSFVPVSPVTLEVRLPWSEFASNLRIFGGFGRPNELRSTVIADQFEGVMDAHTLIRFADYPVSATVLDSLGTERVDENLTFRGAILHILFDTTSNSNGDRTASLRASLITESWDARAATWEVARGLERCADGMVGARRRSGHVPRLGHMGSCGTSGYGLHRADCGGRRGPGRHDAAWAGAEDFLAEPG